MPLSNDNQDYGKSDKKNKGNAGSDKEKLTSDDLKGKQKVDADVTKEKDKPAKQK